MKKILMAIPFILLLNVAHAEGHDGREHGGGGPGDAGRWLGPALIGGIIGYELARPRTVYVQPAPQPIVIVPQGTYSGPAPQPVYQEFVEYDPNCNCYMHVLRQIGWR